MSSDSECFHSTENKKKIILANSPSWQMGPIANGPNWQMRPIGLNTKGSAISAPPFARRRWTTGRRAASAPFPNFILFFVLWKRIGWIERKTKFPIFIFRVMVIFVLKMTPIFDEFSPITRKIKIGEIIHYFSILYSTLPIIHKNWIKTQGRRGLHILN